MTRVKNTNTRRKSSQSKEQEKKEAEATCAVTFALKAPVHNGLAGK